MQEKRAYSRKTIDVEVSCEREGGAVASGRSKDISLGGMFILSEDVPKFGEKVTVVLTLPNASGELRLPGVVRWSDKEASGFGVQFGLMGARETHALAKMMGQPR